MKMCTTAIAQTLCYALLSVIFIQLKLPQEVQER